VQIRLSARSPWKLDVTDPGFQDPIFTFSTDRQANEQILDNLPGMFWHFPVTKAKPGATVLAVHADPRMRNEYGQEVLIASQRVGPGWSIFIGFDSTYRWRYLDEQFFDGFWARVIDRAGRSKQLGGNYPFRLSTPQATYQPGGQAKMLTPPGPTSRPTTMSTMPHRSCLRMIASTPAMTRTTARIHRMVAMRRDAPGLHCGTGPSGCRPSGCDGKVNALFGWCRPGRWAGRRTA